MNRPTCRSLRVRLVPWLVLASLALAACGSAPAAPPASKSGGGGSAAPSTYDIYAVLSGSGQIAFLGQPEMQALQVLEKTVNQQGGIQGHPIHFIIQDDQSDPKTAVQLTSQILAKKVPVILGSDLVAMCNAMAPLAEKSHTVEYCFSPGIHPPKGSYVFTTSVSTDDLARADAAYFRSQGWTRIAVLTSTDASGQDADRAIKAAFSEPQNNSLHIVAYEHFNPQDVSVSAQIARIKAQSPQAMIAWASGTPIGTAFKDITAAGLDIPVATTNANQTYVQMQRMASFLPKQLLIATAEWPAYDTLPAGPVKDALKTYFDAFQAQGVKPDMGQSLAWDPAVIVIDALKHLGVNATATQIRDYIEGLHGFAGIDGTYDFSASAQRGLGLQQVIMTRWDPAKGTWVPVSGPGGAPLQK